MLVRALVAVGGSQVLLWLIRCMAPAVPAMGTLWQWQLWVSDCLV